MPLRSRLLDGAKVSLVVAAGAGAAVGLDWLWRDVVPLWMICSPWGILTRCILAACVAPGAAWIAARLLRRPFAMTWRGASHIAVATTVLLLGTHLLEEHGNLYHISDKYVFHAPYCCGRAHGIEWWATNGGPLQSLARWHRNKRDGFWFQWHDGTPTQATEFKNGVWPGKDWGLVAEYVKYPPEPDSDEKRKHWRYMNDAGVAAMQDAQRKWMTGEYGPVQIYDELAERMRRIEREADEKFPSREN